MAAAARRGQVSIEFEAADPELYTLQVEVDELTRIGLDRAADDLCLQFEVSHGMLGLTRSMVTFNRLPASGGAIQAPAAVTAAYPLLELSEHAQLVAGAAVEQAFSGGGPGRFVTNQDVNDFDDHARYQLEHLGDFQFDATDPTSAIVAPPPALARVWAIAATNFLVARQIGEPVLIAYTATTLAELYARLRLPTLPYVLYSIAAQNAERAGQANYAVNAHGQCAHLLTARGLLGAAIRHLEAALPYADRTVPANRSALYSKLAECHAQLGDLRAAGECYRLAAAVDGITDEVRTTAKLALTGLAARPKTARVGAPPLVIEGLALDVRESIDTPGGPLVLAATSRHELYDSLLQLVDTVHSTLRSLTGREIGNAYLASYTHLMDALVRLALDLELPANALRHLEEQKCVILNSRLRYLLRDRPAEVPDHLWDDLQRLLSVHRRMVEQPAHTDPEGNLDAIAGPTFLDVADAIGTKLWELSQFSAAGAKRIRRRFAYSQLPEQITCADPDQTLILEFCPRACFLVRPDSLGDPIAVDLPDATPETAEHLANEFTGIMEDWVDHFRQAPALADAPPDRRFRTFLTRLDEVFYRPIASYLDGLRPRRLCLIPYRVLHVLPLNLLGLSSSSSLAERYELSFTPSLTTLDTLAATSGARQRFLIVTDPVPRCPAATCRARAHDCWSLEGTDHEGRALAARLRGQGKQVVELSGGEATLSRVTGHLSTADIVHIGTHGFFDSDQPERSGLLMALPGDEPLGNGPYLTHDGTRDTRHGPSTVGELCTLDHVWKSVDMLGCRLLNLSACSSGMTQWSDRSDEFYGLANGFLYAGALAVLTTLWPAEDEVYAVFNRYYYEALLGEGGTPVTALRVATQRLWAHPVDGAFPFRHPWFWAGYRVVGFE